MDDPYLDARSSRRVWEDRPRGPFEVNEPLPKPVQLWKDRTNKTTNKPQELLHFGWQRNAAQRIFESLELHSYEWTVKQGDQDPRMLGQARSQGYSPFDFRYVAKPNPLTLCS